MNKPPSPLPWPPLVSPKRLPLLILVRDALLTTGMWLLLGYLMRDGLMLARDFLSHPLFVLTVTEPPDWPALGRRMAPYAVLATVLVGWLLFWAVVRRKRLRDSSPKPSPAALDPALQAAAFGLPGDEAARWQQMRSIVVDFRPDGSIAAAKAHVPGTPPGSG